MIGQEYQKIVGPLISNVTEASRAIAQINRGTLAEILELLGEQSSRSVRYAYNRRAFPGVYYDQASVQSQLAAAMELDDLTGDQRDQLSDLGASYLSEYERLCLEMIDIMSSGGMDPSTFDQDDWTEWQKRQEQIQMIQFDRNELSYRAAARLEALLGGGQIARIGGLPSTDGQR